MHFSTSTALALLLPLSLAAPSPCYPQYLNEPPSAPSASSAPSAQPTISSIPPPNCSLTNIAQPPSTLIAPPSNQTLTLIALGLGTQNYTCGTNTTMAPTSFGAKANLYDASCEIAANPSINPSSAGKPLVGKHFFVDATTPDFWVPSLGNTQMKKAQGVNATEPTENVQLLRLVAQPQGSTSDVKQVYRLNTQGGVAPSSCEGRAAGDVVTVQYSAQYWFYT